MGAACACCTRSTTSTTSPNRNRVASHSPNHQPTIRNAEGRTKTSGDASGSISARAHQPEESSSQQSLYNRRKVAHAPHHGTTILRLQEEDLGPSSDAPSVSQPVPVATIVPSPLHTQTTQSIVDTSGEGPTEDIVDLIVNTEEGTEHNTTASRSSLSSGGIVGGRCPPGRTAVVRRGAAGPVVAALQDTTTSGNDAPLTVHNERQYATTPTSFTVVDGLPHEQQQCEQNAVTPSSTTMGNPSRGGGGGGRVMFRNPSDESMRVTSSVASPAGGGGGAMGGGSVVAAVVVSFPDLPPMPESSTPSLSHQPLHQLTTETSGDPSLFNQSSCGSGTKSSLQLSETAVQRFRSDLIHNSGGNNSSTTTTTTTSTTTTSGSLTSARGGGSVTTPLPPCASSSSGDSSGGGLIGAPTRSPSIPEFPGSK